MQAVTVGIVLGPLIEAICLLFSVHNGPQSSSGERSILFGALRPGCSLGWFISIKVGCFLALGSVKIKACFSQCIGSAATAWTIDKICISPVTLGDSACSLLP